MKKLPVIFLFVFCSFCSSTQLKSQTLTINVFDEDSISLANASVYLIDSDTIIKQLTDSTGEVSFDVECNKKYFIKVEHPRCYFYKKRICDICDKNIINVVLRKIEVLH